MHRHGEGLYSYSLIDRLEAVPAEAGAWQWEAQGWVGGDLRRLWWRSRGHVAAGRLEQGELALFAGRAVRPWWDVLAGVRQQRGDGPRRDWLGFGVQGLAPYKFELSATAYLGRAGRHQLRLDGEYDTLLSHRLILQWRAEALLQARADPAWRLGAGLATLEAGLRLRYEIDRQFAPYLGWELERGYGATARLRRAGGQPVREGRWVAGVRLWF